MMQFSYMAEPILWQLWNASWQGGLVVLLTLAFIGVIPSLPVVLHCWLWRLVCIKMLIAFFCVGGIELAVVPQSAIQPNDKSSGSVTHAPIRVVGLNDADRQARPPASSTQRPTVERQRSGFNNRSLAASLLLIAWIGGLMWHAAAVGMDWKRSAQLIHRSAEVDEGRIHTSLANAAARFGLATPRLKQSSAVAAPVVVGVIHPTIILPSTAQDAFSPSQIRLLLAHELAHIRRRDLIWNWLGVVCGVLFFFNPLVWMVQRRWRGAQEAACDALVLDTVPGALSEYANLLLQCSHADVQVGCGFLSGALTDFESLKRRIEQMKNRTCVSKSTLVGATGCLIFASIVGVTPWKLVPATAAEIATESTDGREANEPAVSVLQTFEISPDESVLAHDGPVPVDHRPAFRQQRRNARRLAKSGRLGRGGARTGGIRSSVGGSRQFQGPNGAAAGGFASGTIERPNFGIALRLSSVKQPALVTVAPGTVAMDLAGNEYEPLTQLGIARMSVPKFEAEQPDCAGAYFRLDPKRRPKSFAEIRGRLRVTPIYLHQAAFELASLSPGARRQTPFGEISIGRFANDTGWKFEVTTPGPGSNIREVFRYAGMVYVELIDSNGNAHRPRLKNGSGGGGSVNGNAPGIEEITQIVVFESLDEGVRAEKLVVRIRELGTPNLIPFTVKDVALN